MGKPMKLALAGRHFGSRTEARAHMRNIRRRWRSGCPVEGADHDFLLAVFRHHPAAAEKAGAGVDHFEVRRAPKTTGKPTTCFWVVSLDGTATDFSARKALKGAYEHQLTAREMKGEST